MEDKFKNSILRFINKFKKFIIKPSKTIPDPKLRRQSQILSLTSFTLMSFLILSTISSHIFNPYSFRLLDKNLLIILILFIIFILSKKNYIFWGSTILVWILFLLILYIGLDLPDMLTFLAVPVLISCIFQDIKRLSFTYLLFLLTLPLYSYIHPNLTLEDIFYGIFSFISIIVIITLIYKWNTNTLNNIRVKQFTKHENFVNSVIENVNEAIISIDSSFKIKSLNEAAKKIFNYNESELLDKHISKILLNKTKFQNIITNIKNKNNVSRLYGKDRYGRIINIEISPSKYTFENEIYFTLIIRDITFEKETSEKLLLTEQKFKELFDNMSNCVAIYEARDNGSDFIFKDFNKAAEKTEKIKREDIIGKSVLQIFPSIKKFGLFEVFQKVWETGKPKHFPLKMYKDKRIAGWRDNYVYKLSTGEIVAIYKDVTEEQQLKENLEKRTQELFQRVRELNCLYNITKLLQKTDLTINETIQKIADIIPKISVNNDQITARIIVNNQAYLSRNYSESENSISHTISSNDKIIGKLELSRLTKQDNKNSNLFSDNAINLTTTISEIIGNIVELKTASKELKLSESKYRKLSKELDERVRKRTKELKIANEELEAFTYSVSHDLRAPLRHIGGFSQIINTEYKDKLPNKAKTYFEKIINGITKMNKLIDGLLDLSRIGRKALTLTKLDLNEIVTQVVSEFEDEISEYEIKVIIHELPTLECDEILMTTVFRNLISNAIKYTSNTENAKIEIGPLKQNETGFYIKDNGAGFDMKYQNQLFGIFQRLHKAKDFEGIGIGLATVKRIIEKHNGSIKAVGKPGKGATFYIKFNL
ncbi:PAS domain S-box protein [Candidatus Dojkabacteria bacterium]|nr:PAS domain S-box protein [Candidatus Dojkabacteria bacterium]